MGMQGMRSHPQRWKIGHYSGKIFQNWDFFAPETILPFFFAPDGKINTALEWTGIMW